MNQVNPVLSDARGYGYTGKVPDGATGVKKGSNGEIIFLFGDGKPSQSMNPDGSVFTQPTPADNNGASKVETPQPADNNGGGNTPAASGNGSGTQNSVFGNGFGGMMGGGFGFGMGQSYMDAGFEVDPQKFNNAAFGLSSIINLGTFMPAGLGSLFSAGGIMAAMEGFMKAVRFNFNFGDTTTEVSTRDDSPDETTTSGGATGQKTKPDEAPAPAPTPTPTPTPTTGGTSSGTPDGSTGGGSVSGPATTSTSRKGKTKKKQPTQQTHTTSSSGSTSHTQQRARTKTEADLAKEGGYVKLSNGKYRKNGQIYEFKNGKFTYFADNTFNDGRYVKDGKVYDANGTPSKNTVAMGNSKTMRTLAYFQNDGNDYKISHYKGQTVLETKSGNPKITRYFDSAGRLVQTNSFDRGGMFRDSVNSVSRYTYNKNGVLTKEEATNVLKNRTVTTEYNVRNAKPGRKVTKGPVLTEQRMDGQGRVSTFKFQATTTVEVVMVKGHLRRVTTVVKNPVR